MQRTYFTVMGILFIILGLLGLVLPILQGVFFIAVGLVLLSFAFPAVRGALKRHTARRPKLDALIMRVEKRLLEEPHWVWIGFLAAVGIAAIPIALWLWG